MQQVTITAEMADGTCIVEHVEAFADFTGIVLGFRRDSDCVRLTWHETPEPPEDDERMYETSGSCLWNQSKALDTELAEADYQRWAPSGGSDLDRAVERIYWRTQRGRFEGLIDQEAA